MSEHGADFDAGLLRRRTEAEARKCSQAGCPGDGRYQPPGRGHLPGCEHNAVRWVWEEINTRCSCGWDKPLGPKCPDCGGLTVWQDASVTSPEGGEPVEYEWGVTQGDEPVRTLHEEGARFVAGRQQEGHPRRRLMRRTLGPWVEVPQDDDASRVLPTADHDHDKCCRYLLCAHPTCCGYNGEASR